jgi:hypothetical protein
MSDFSPQVTEDVKQFYITTQRNFSSLVKSPEHLHAGVAALRDLLTGAANAQNFVACSRASDNPQTVVDFYDKAKQRETIHKLVDLAVWLGCNSACPLTAEKTSTVGTAVRLFFDAMADKVEGCDDSLYFAAVDELVSAVLKEYTSRAVARSFAALGIRSAGISDESLSSILHATKAAIQAAVDGVTAEWKEILLANKGASNG